MSGLSLDHLALQIHREHQSAVSAAGTAIEHARRCGELLIQAKARIGHGGFLRWVTDHCHVGERQARNYMRVAQNWEAIANRQRASDLTLRQALALTRRRDGIIELHHSIEAAVSERRELAERLTPGSPAFVSWLEGIMTPEALREHGADTLEHVVHQEAARLWERHEALTAWLDDVSAACSQRMRDLEAA
jgi:hypothetical protein